MPHYEVIYEDGTMSVANYADDEEASRALTAANDRAKSGQRSVASDPNSPAATRIKRVFVYDEPPGDYNPEGMLSADVAKEEVTAALKAATEKGVTDLFKLAALIRDISNPFVVTGPHESNYKATETRELNSSLWGGE